MHSDYYRVILCKYNLRLQTKPVLVTTYTSHNTHNTLQTMGFGYQAGGTSAGMRRSRPPGTVGAHGAGAELT